MKVVVISVIAIVIAIGFFWSPSDVSLVDASPETVNSHDASVQPAVIAPTTAANEATTQAHKHNTEKPGTSEKAHIDHLSPEMKQALKDKLFHHGPKTITKDDRGLIRMDHAGRYVNMPVAVRKADGSIEIKEYSVVPETHTEVTQ